MQLVDAGSVGAALAALARDGKRAAVLAPPPPADSGDAVTWIVASADDETYGRELYAHLRALDQAGADVIVVARPPEGADWVAIHDRLTRAAAHRGDEP